MPSVGEQRVWTGSHAKTEVQVTPLNPGCIATEISRNILSPKAEKRVDAPYQFISLHLMKSYADSKARLRATFIGWSEWMRYGAKGASVMQNRIACIAELAASSSPDSSCTHISISFSSKYVRAMAQALRA
jgi:hypothetical protein